ncbi:DnaT-like ssDNA-binding domain-containing protein [Neptuniibacter sp. QD72_48]|uniref:DnaT-like ssDNA-binding domain-containing protein n=1 Tax=unclassified Neptuniibacter TaxID=2630693 RepID=UPI0039F6C388
MSYVFSETPILLYPSLVKEVGVEAAVLLTLYHQRVERLQNVTDTDQAPELIFSREQWLALGEFWDEERLAQLTSELVSANIIDAAFANDGRVRIRFVVEEQVSEVTFDEVPEGDVEIVSRLPVMETIPTQVEELPVEVEQSEPSYAQSNYNQQNHPQTQPAQSGYPQDQYPEMKDTPYYPDQAPAVQPQNIPNPGPAPTFGGSIGWARKAQQVNNGRSDELQVCFNKQEQRKKQLQGMELNWQPSDNFYALLPRHNISPQFAQTCLDEFVLYWLDKDRKETNWDQKFLAWVKREWINKQTRDGRQQRINNEQQGKGFSHENPRRDTREKRQRVTAAIMDIKDTDW